MNESLILNNLVNDYLNGDLSFAIETLLMLSSFVYFWYAIFNYSGFTSSGLKGLSSQIGDNGIVFIGNSLNQRHQPIRKSVLNKAYSLNSFSKQRLYVGMKQNQKSNLDVFHAKNESLRVGSII